MDDHLLSLSDRFTLQYRRSFPVDFNVYWIGQKRALRSKFFPWSASPPTLPGPASQAAGQGYTPLAMCIRLLPPGWRRGWVFVALGFFLIGIATFIYRLIQRHLRLTGEWQVEQHKRVIAEQASEAKSHFLATLSHEVRTPMTGILGMSELLLQMPLNARQYRYVAAIKSAGEHLLCLVNDTLDLARIEAGKLSLDQRNFAISALIEHIVALMQPNAEKKGLRFICSVDPLTPPYVYADRHRIGQILLNLLTNAIKFTERGYVALHLKALSKDHEHGLCFEVKDTGLGISAEQSRRLFQRFEQAQGGRTAAQYGGSGLGLAICRELTAMMGGSIRAESHEGRGTCFRVELPMRAGLSAQPADKMASATHDGQRILLIENDDLLSMDLTKLLRTHGYQVWHAHCGLDVLTLLVGQRFDVAIFDLGMASLFGLELIKQLRAKGHDFPLIALSASTDADFDVAVKQAGCTAFFSKPVDLNHLIAAIAALIKTTVRAN